MSQPINLIARSDTGLSPEALTALNGQLDALAGLCERDGRNIARLFFNCLSVLTAADLGDSSVRELLGCLLGSRAWAAVSEDLTAARYAAQLLLERLLDRGLADRGLLTAGLNRLGGGDSPLAAVLRERLGKTESALPAYMEDALGDEGLAPDAPLTYAEFITALAADGGWLYRRLSGGQRPACLPGGHLLPLAGAELLLRLDGERRTAVDELLSRLNRREPRYDHAALRARLLESFIARHAPLAADARIPCRDLLAEFICCLHAAQAEGLCAPAASEDTEGLSWEMRVFRASGGLVAGGWGYGSGSRRVGSGRFGSGFGSGRFGSGRFGSGAGSGFGSGRFGSGRFGSGSGFGSGRYGSGGSAVAALGMGAFAGSGPEDGLGGVYGLELIDAPATEEQLFTKLLALLADTAL